MGVEGVARGRGEMRSLLLRVGVALFLSFAGFLYTHLRSRGDRRGSRRGRAPQGASGAGVEEAGKEVGSDLNEELLHTQQEEASSNVRDGTSVKGVASPAVGLSPRSKNLGDEGFLLPEFNELVFGEFELFGLDPDAPKTTPTNGLLQDKGEKVSEQEIVNLRNLAQLLWERVASLEIQLLEYYGLKEQESTVRELENQLKFNTMEAKLLSLRIEALQAENRRLGEQLSDDLRIKAELQAAWAKIKHLEGKLLLDSVQANDKVAELYHGMEALQDRECRGEYIEEAEMKLKHLEDETEELRRANSRLAKDNSDFAAKLSTQFLAPSVLESTEATKALEEANSLRQTNDELTKEITRLQIDHCADLEELVYLRWINACLRYELRNYQPPTGKPAARDLNKTLSPKSEQKAKQLILEYANSEINEKCSNLLDFDSEYCSTSQSSLFTGNREIDDSSVDVSTSTKDCSSNKTRFLRKLKRLVLGKDIHHDMISSMDRSPTSCGILDRRASVSACSFDDIMGRSSYDSVASCTTSDNVSGNQLMAVEGKVRKELQNEAPWTRNLSRVSLDFRRLKSHEKFGEMKGEHCKRSKSVVGASYWHTMSMGEESVDQETFDLSEKLEMKYGHASNSPNGKPKLRTRSASFSSY